MTLTTHAVAGALIGAVAWHNPPFAVVASFLSHPLLDSIPHWDYPASSIDDDPDPTKTDMRVGGRNFFQDILKIGFDFCSGLLIVAFVFSGAPSAIFFTVIVCALAAIAPDPLQFVYWKTKSRLLAPWQRFHVYMHAKTKLKDRPVFGVLSQAAIILIILICIYRFSLFT